MVSILKRPAVPTAWGTWAGIRTSSPAWARTVFPPILRVAVPSWTLPCLESGDQFFLLMAVAGVPG
jgi:hypothetical protein